MNWHDYFTADFELGVLTWKRRPLAHFTTERIWKIWNTKFAGRVAGNETHGYWQVRINSKPHYAHRILWEMANGAIPAGLKIDHRDGNGMNNTPYNLRLATSSQNALNARKTLNNKSGYKGVFWYKKLRKWAAYVRIDGRSKYLGVFPDVESAARAYAEAASTHHGQFFRL